MHFATILFSMIFVLNGLSILNGARLRIDSRSGKNICYKKYYLTYTYVLEIAFEIKS